MKKVFDWKQHLTNLINEKRNEEFAWGTHDCFQFIANCIKVTTDKDIAENSRGNYSTPEGAYKTLLKTYKVETLKDLLPSLGYPEQHIAFAKPGDIVYKNSNQDGFNCALGICYGPHSFFILEMDGFVMLNTLELDGSFRV